MVDIYRAAEQRDKHMPLLASPSANNCFNTLLYQSGGLPIPIPRLTSDELAKKLSLRIQDNTSGRIGNRVKTRE